MRRKLICSEREREKNAKFQNAEEKRGEHPDNDHWCIPVVSKIRLNP